MSTAAFGHVEISDSGVPMISGTTIKVIEIALDRIAHGWDAEQIHRQHPHLSLGQIHSALAWYYDHQADMDCEVQAQVDEVRRLRAEAGESLVRKKLTTEGRLP